MKLKRLEEEAAKLGFRFAFGKYGNREIDGIGLMPKDIEALPLYTRDTELWYGDSDSIESFFAGIRWARQYDNMLRLSSDKTRERKEQDVRNRNLLKKLVNSGNKDNA
jgi:hypothetical protein